MKFSVEHSNPPKKANAAITTAAKGYEITILLTYLQWEDSNVRKNTDVRLGLTLPSTQDAQVFNAVLKAEAIGIPSFRDPPSRK